MIGEGEARGQPDVVNMQVGVEARAVDPKVAIEAANTKMARLIEVLKQTGVKPEDMQTRDFSVNSEYIEPGYGEPLDESVSSETAPAPVEMAPVEMAPRPLAEPKSAPAMKNAGK